MFRWFKKREQPKLIDRDLGELTLQGGYWWGEVAFGGAKVQVLVRDEHGNPAQGVMAAIEEFGRRYTELQPAFAVELRELFEPWHKEWWTGQEPLEKGDSLLAQFELVSIEVEPPAIKQLGFCLKKGWDDATFRVSLDGWIPKGLGVED